MRSKVLGRTMQSSVRLVCAAILSAEPHRHLYRTATASYRLHPLIILNPKMPIPPHLADKFQKCFAPGVIHVEPSTKAVTVNEQNMRGDTVSREVLRHPEFQGCVDLKRVRDFFLCKFYLFTLDTRLMCTYLLVHIESEGPYAPERLFLEAIKVMREKIANIRQAAVTLLDDGESRTGEDVEMAGA
jgi:DNA-directed RNA polymerase I and III subunit RPAC1